MQKIAILGSSGSIGTNALEVIRKNPDLFKVTALTVNTSIELLKEQIEEFSPEVVVVRCKEKAAQLREELKGNTNVEILSGEEGLINMTKNAEYNTLLSSLVGFAGLAPTIEAIKRKKRIALANKETLVAAGEIVMGMVKEYGCEFIPVDSEHSALFQCLVGETHEEVKRIILTASGGPFRKRTLEELKSVTIKDALNHPNWKMGSKITIDSATMMNKGLEVIEAMWLFDMPPHKIDVVVHPQSVIHSMVEYIDGSVKAKLSMPDMKLPIQYAFTYPERIKANFVENNFPVIGNLTFSEPDTTKFRCLQLAYDAMEQGGASTCILNAANEIAVEKFLDGTIKFLDIPVYIEMALQGISNVSNPCLETIFEIDRQTRNFVRDKI